MATTTERVHVDEAGYIVLEGRMLSQREAIDLAGDLAQAVQDSIYRGQIGTNRYHSTEGILERMNSKLGQAISAMRKVYA